MLYNLLIFAKGNLLRVHEKYRSVTVPLIRYHIRTSSDNPESKLQFIGYE